MKYVKNTNIAILFLVIQMMSVGLSARADESLLKTNSSLSADFAMSRTISALKTDLKSKGRIVLGGEGRLRWETLSPAKSVLVINHGKGWIHYPDMNVTKSFDLSFDPVMRMMSEQLSALTSGKFDAIGNLYDVSEPKDGRRTLLPKSPEIKKLFKEMQVTVDAGGAVTEVLLVSANGDTTSISFQNTILNPKLDDALFEEPKSR